jgi:hypothetical protein
MEMGAIVDSFIVRLTTMIPARFRLLAQEASAWNLVVDRWNRRDWLLCDGFWICVVVEIVTTC